MASHVAGFAVAVVVVDELHAILSSWRGARVRQAFVDITFASGAHETWWTLALEPANFVDARSIVMASSNRTIVNVEFANETQSSRRTRATEVADEIVTGAAILARIGPTIVHVKFTVLTLEALRALTLIGAN